MFGSRFSFWEKKAKNDGAPKTPLPPEQDPPKSSQIPAVRKKSLPKAVPNLNGTKTVEIPEEKNAEVDIIGPVTANELHASSQSISKIEPVLAQECKVVKDVMVSKKAAGKPDKTTVGNLKSPSPTGSSSNERNNPKRKKKKSKVVKKKKSLEDVDSKIKIDKVDSKPSVFNNILKQPSDEILKQPSDDNLKQSSDDNLREPCHDKVDNDVSSNKVVSMDESQTTLTLPCENSNTDENRTLSDNSDNDKLISENTVSSDPQILPDSSPSESLPSSPSDLPLSAYDAEVPQQNADSDTAALVEKVSAPVESLGNPTERETSPLVFNEEEWSEGDPMWLVHETGFSAAHILKQSDDNNALKDGQVRVKLDHSQDKVVVSEELLENINPPELDRAEDVLSLRHLNECGILHTLKQRFGGNLQYTYAGQYLLAVCPPIRPPVIQMFKGCRRSDMPPHIFSAVQVAYKDLVNTKTDQSLVLMGRSGSGKTQNIHHILSYLIKVGAVENGNVTHDKLNAVSSLLSSFSSAGTTHCNAATRCVHMYSIDIDKSAQVTGASVQAMLLEKCRVSRRPPDQENFRVFYQIIEGGGTALMKELFLLSDEQYNNPMLFDPGDTKTEAWKDNAREGFKSMEKAFNLLKFSSDEIKSIYHVIAACLHLAMAGVQRVSAMKYQFAKPDAAQKASSLLGISIENLSRNIFQSSAPSRNLSSPTRSPSSPRSQHEEFDGQSGYDNLQAFIIGLYNEVFRVVVSLINRNLSSLHHAQNSMLIVDIPGIQYNNGCRMDDLIYNYATERVKLLFHHEAFTRIRDRYEQEDVHCDMEAIESEVNGVPSAIDMPPSQQRSGKNLATDKKGLMWLLDEEAMIAGATEETFIERLLLFFGQPIKNQTPLMTKSVNKNHFKINHFLGECPIEYDATNWLKLSRENPVEKVAIDTLQDSKKKYISIAFGGKVAGGLMQGSVVGLEGGGLMLRRAASMRKAWSGGIGASAAIKKKSLPLIKKLQVDSLIDSLRRTNIHFIFCAKPYEITDVGSDKVVDVKELRQQLRTFKILEATRVYKQGYVEHCVYGEFRQKFDVICRQMGLDGESQRPQTSNGKLLSSMDDKEATEAILQEAGLAKSQYKLGLSQVLLRFGVLSSLEDRRNEKLNNIILAFQAKCRGYLARKLIEKRKVQTIAVKCIQRNIRKFVEVREWPWWRLLTKVIPLVAVHQTEDNLREKEAELEIVRSKYAKILAERDELKEINGKYESQIHELSTNLAEEKSTATHSTELLEQETVERMKLEKDVIEFQAMYEALKEKSEAMQIELAEVKLLHSADNDQYSSDEDGDVSEYKIKYEREKREAKFQHGKVVQEFEDQIEQLQSDKKHVEKKMHQLEEEVAENERIANQQKKKAQRLLHELNDTKVHLEETKATCHDLEKKQRRFDSEMYSVQADLTELKSAKEKLQREKESNTMEIYRIQGLLDEKTENCESLEQKIKNLEQELEETTLRDSEDGQMVNSLKKQKRELEAKVKDQEEELDEQAGQIQMLQQSKERLEMNNERNRQQHSRDIDAKDEELEELRQSYHKKIKILEAQVEEEEEERSNLSKSKKAVEQQLAELRDQQPTMKRNAESDKRLRKELKRYKALLSDAQTMIDHLKTDAVNKQQLRQLKSKLEDSEYNCAVAVKGKKAIELELEDIQAQLDEISRAKQECEEKISHLQRENHELNSRMEEDEDDNKELTRKYKQLVIQLSEDKKSLVELSSQLDDLKREKEISNEKILSLQNQLQYMEDNTTDKSNITRLDTKVRDLEMKLDFEKTSSRRLEVQLTRVKEQIEKQKSELDSLSQSEQREKDQNKRITRQYRESQEEQSELIKKEQDALQKKHELELELDDQKNQNESLQSDLKLAFKRISDLQAAFEDLENSDLDEFSGSSDESDSDVDYPASSWRSRRTGARSISTTSHQSSILSSDDYNKSSLSFSPDESKFSDSSTSTVLSTSNGKKLSAKQKRERRKKAHKKLIKELKECRKNGDDFSTCGEDQYENLSSISVSDNFARDDCGGRSTVLSSRAVSSVNSSFLDDASSIKTKSSAVEKTPSMYSKGSLLSRVGKAGGKAAIKLELDRMSKSLANEDPSTLLYGNPDHIAKSLGLGRTRNFRDLNENIMAVKTRQNLPEKQKNKVALSQKIDHEISDMKTEAKREKIYHRRANSYSAMDDDDLYSEKSFKDYSENNGRSSRVSVRSSKPDESKFRPRSYSVNREERFMDDDLTSSYENYGQRRGRLQRGNQDFQHSQVMQRSRSVQGRYEDDDYDLTYGQQQIRRKNLRNEQDFDDIQNKKIFKKQAAFINHNSDDLDLEDTHFSKRASPGKRSRQIPYHGDENQYYTDGECTLGSRKSQLPSSRQREKGERKYSLSYDQDEDPDCTDSSNSYSSYSLPRQSTFSKTGKYSKHMQNSSISSISMSGISRPLNSRKSGRSSEQDSSERSFDLDDDEDDVSLSKFGVRSGRPTSRARSNYGSEWNSSSGQNSRSSSLQRDQQLSDDEPINIDTMINKSYKNVYSDSDSDNQTNKSVTPEISDV